ncbi:Serine/threonine-protein kinase plk1 [Phlyctochytrium bullatum]|nr:Serine/threonine-protein kinase plk1 [Phlyctochytrium bullatum]
MPSLARPWPANSIATAPAIAEGSLSSATLSPVSMLGREAIRSHDEDTNYVPRLPNAQASATSTGIAWRGTVNPNDISIRRCVVANLNCTIHKGVHRGLAVIVKRSTNKDLIQREIDFLDRARCEFVVGYGGWFEEVEVGIMGLVMQKCAMDLKDWSDMVSRSPPADLNDKMLHISEDIAKGLAFINNLNIVHNDLKPRNVFVDRYCKPYIGDFGVATNRGEPLIGSTKQYFDKESLGVIPDEKSDSWLLGATLWEFWSDEAFNVEEDIRLDHIRNSNIKDILKKLLRPRDRRPSAREILSLFDSTTVRSDYETVSDDGITAPQSPIPPPRNVSLSLLQSPIWNSEDRNLSHMLSAVGDPTMQYWDALAVGDTGALTSILRANLVPVDTEKDGLTGLQFACLKNLSECVKALLEFGADHLRRDEDWNLPIQLSTSVEVWRAVAAMMPPPQGDLFDAAENGDDVSARLILSAATDPSALISQQKVVELASLRKKRTVTPLHVAAFCGHATVCELFLCVGADVNCRSNRHETPLILAAWKGHLSVVQILVERGANFNYRNGAGHTPLHKAVEKGDVDIVQFLLYQGANVDCKDVDGSTPLFWAAGFGDPSIMQVLVGSGADIEARGFRGKTALHWAAVYGHEDVVSFLIERGADVNCSDDLLKNTPLMEAAEREHLQVVQVLVENGASIEAENQNGQTPLYLAVSEGHADIVRFLLDKGADVNRCNAYNKTPLVEAASRGHLRAVQALVDRGADADCRDRDGMTACDWAWKNGHTDIADYLAPVTKEVPAFY